MSVKKKKTKKVLTPEQKAELNRSPSYSWGRFIFVATLLGLAFFILIYKSTALQIFNSDFLIKKANNNSLREEKISFTRGSILDRNERILSISVPMYTFSFDPQEYFLSRMQRSKQSWRELAKETQSSQSKIESNVNKYIQKRDLAIDVKALFNPESEQYWQDLAKITELDYRLLVERVRNNPNSKFVRLETERSEEETHKLKELASIAGKKWQEFREDLYKNRHKRDYQIARYQSEDMFNFVKNLKVATLTSRVETRRMYPLKEKAAHLIGFVNNENKGGEGIERSFNALLEGKDGKRVVRRDRYRRLIEDIRTEQQYDPQDIVLSIDEELQTMVFDEISKAVKENDAESGTAVLVDVRTGEILAMANAPSYNPNNLNTYKGKFARNRAITDTFEPGSTVKPLVVLTALQNGVTYRDEVLNTRPFMVNGHTIKDVSPRESLSLTGILQKSSNVGVSRLALRMPPSALVDTYSKVGFGKDTGLGLGEQRGKNGDRGRWSEIERATLSYGYGLTVTPLQLVRAYATLGSFGIFRPLSITKVDPPVIGERVLPEKITRDVVQMMEAVAAKGEGGQRAAVEGYRVAIKTGTARKIEGGKYVDKYLAYTAGIAPASDPRFALVVLINEPKAGAYYGGAVSAPLFSSIMGETLRIKNIKPDNL